MREIWEFLDLLPSGQSKRIYTLHAADIVVDSISEDQLWRLREDESYDTELLPSIFTFREILWQPDVFDKASLSLPGLRILKAYCEEVSESLGTSDSPLKDLYGKLILGLSLNCETAIAAIERKGGAEKVRRILGDFRTKSFPVVKFFIYHPKNRLDYYRDALNRLNYAVKIILTEFHGRYTELEDPYWVVTEARPKPASKKAVSDKAPNSK